MEKKIIRVFPRQTRATPIDENVRIRCMPDLWDSADEVHISVTFTWDRAWAENAAKQWKYVAQVKIGGPAYNIAGGEFVPGMYLKKGYTITSRGCNNRCWFCNVPKREGGIIRELNVKEGWIITDDNLLACSEKHIQKVFYMLKNQLYHPLFTGGLEAKILTFQRAVELFELKPKRMYFAYDTPDDLGYLIVAGKMLREAGFKKQSNILSCYVLIGYKGDSEVKAVERLRQTFKAGFMPMAMLYRDEKGEQPQTWKHFQREWANPKITYCNCLKYFGNF